MRPGHLVYWLITGALLGVAVLGYPVWQLVMLPVGFVPLIIGLLFLRGRELVAGVLSFGFVPGAVLVVVLATWKFPPDVPPMYPPVYLVAVLIFGIISVAGLVALVVLWRASRRVSGALMHWDPPLP